LNADDLAPRVQSGDRRALARAITLVESGRAHSAPLLRALYARAGAAVTIGVTGFPGAGKSSLVDRLIEAYRTRGKTVGVIAVDPSSAFSGGAILGDRIRMMRHTGDPGVFIRSMATRGHLGGLARAAGEVQELLDAAGFDVVIVETVGVGQSEVDIARLADATLVVLVPGMGDDIQAIKAGILEIADLFVINKADRDGADKLVSELQHMMMLGGDAGVRPPILKTVATRGEGVLELVLAIEARLGRPETERLRAERRLRRARVRLTDVLGRALFENAVDRGIGVEHWNRIVERLARRETDPYTAADEIVAAGRG
jgi:LAO/AO transport system kinase